MVVMDIIKIASRISSSYDDLISFMGLDTFDQAMMAADVIGEDEVKLLVFKAFNAAFNLNIRDPDRWSFDELQNIDLENIFHELGHQVADPGFFRRRSKKYPGKTRTKSVIEMEMGEEVARGFGNPEGQTDIWGSIESSSRIPCESIITRAQFNRLVRWMEKDASKATGDLKSYVDGFVRRVKYEGRGTGDVDMNAIRGVVRMPSFEEYQTSEESGERLRRFHLILRASLNKALKTYKSS